MFYSIQLTMETVPIPVGFKALVELSIFPLSHLKTYKSQSGSPVTVTRHFESNVKQIDTNSVAVTSLSGGI